MSDFSDYEEVEKIMKELLSQGLLESYRHLPGTDRFEVVLSPKGMSLGHLIESVMRTARSN